MAGADHGKLGRSLRALTIGTVKSMEDRRKEREGDDLRESVEQYQIAVKGRAEEEPSWDRVKLKFSTRFVDGTGQRDSALDRPHFTYGAEIETPHPVALVAYVEEWIVSDRNETVGCYLRIGATTNLRAAKYKGTLHASFQGFGSPTDSHSDIGDAA